MHAAVPQKIYINVWHTQKSWYGKVTSQTMKNYLTAIFLKENLKMFGRKFPSEYLNEFRASFHVKSWSLLKKGCLHHLHISNFLSVFNPMWLVLFSWTLCVIHSYFCWRVKTNVESYLYSNAYVLWHKTKDTRDWQNYIFVHLPKLNYHIIYEREE